MEHHLSVDPVRSFRAKKCVAIVREVECLPEAGFIKEFSYPEWMSNVVLVRKANEKWCMCMDFTDINKACPKNSFLLLRVDMIVDSMAGKKDAKFH